MGEERQAAVRKPKATNKRGFVMRVRPVSIARTR